MKRNIYIVLFFVIITTLMLSSCTFYCEDIACRGWGYEYIRCNMDCFGCYPAKRYVAIEGVDYSKPEIISNGNGFTFKMSAYADFYLNIEICIMQDGVLIDSYEYNKYIRKDTDVTFEEYVPSNHYNTSGGELYYIINKFEAYKKVR